MGAVLLPVIATVASTVAGSLLAPKPRALPLPPSPPEPVEAVEPTPPPTSPQKIEAQRAPEVSPIDVEASRIRAINRRKQAQEQNLIDLSEEEDQSATNLTKSLLGD